MKIKTICLHDVDDPILNTLADFKIVARTKSREDLRLALTSVRPDALIIDLDTPTAIDSLVDAREILPELAIIGVTGETDPKFVISAVRAGCRQISSKPLDVNDLLVAIRRALNESATQVTGRIIGVMASTGGAGATTIAACMAMGAAEVTKQRTLIVDADFDFGGVARAWDLKPEHTIADLLSAGSLDPVLLEKAVVEVPGNVAILARPKTVDQAHAIDDTMMTMLLQTAKTVFPTVVVDFPHKLDGVVWAALQQCDKLVIVIQMTVPAVDNCVRLLLALTSLGMSPDKIEVIVNRYRKNVHFISTDLIEERLQKKVMGLVPNDFKSVCAAIDMGQPIPQDNAVRTAVTKIAAKLAGVSDEAAVAKSGWLSKLRLRTT
ncbi:MAG: AAA family ATPase [Planctomycetota bacterium]